MAVPASLLGASVRRREDPRLITGQGRFVDDMAAEGGLHAAFVRSPVAHGRIRHLDLEPACRLPGVVAALSARDLGLPSRLAFAVMPEVFARPPLATGLVRFVPASDLTQRSLPVI